MENWKLIAEGKVRRVYKNEEAGRVMLVAGDGISAFDRTLGASFQGKGAILTQMSKYWFDQTSDLVPNAYEPTKQEPLMREFLQEKQGFDIKEETVTEMVELQMLPIEAIVRGYITGSAWKSYSGEEKVRMISGVSLPDGLSNSEKLPEPIFTPTTKAPQGQHDENISFVEMTEIIAKMNVGDPELMADLVRHYSLLIYKLAAEQLGEKGIIVADTKFEFGVHEKTGQLMLADEVLTPDSSRFWSMEDYEVGREQYSLDKQIIRNWVKDHPGERIDAETLEATKSQYERIASIVMGKWS